MSQKTDKFEIDICNVIQPGIHLSKLPMWMKYIGCIENDVVNYVQRIGGQGSKTDVLVVFKSGFKLKISLKLTSADYFGNWYSHRRIEEEFGFDNFNKLTSHCTKWANDVWSKSLNASFFVGVSVNFGKRTGSTGIEFTDIFNYTDIIKIVAGIGNNDDSANCILISDEIPNYFQSLIDKLRPINSETISEIAKNFKVIYRPINPQTEGSNRGKCIYTQFKPYSKLPVLTRVDTLGQLLTLGRFVEVEMNGLNHNRLINSLREEYNIDIPVK